MQRCCTDDRTEPGGQRGEDHFECEGALRRHGGRVYTFISLLPSPTLHFTSRPFHPFTNKARAHTNVLETLRYLRLPSSTPSSSSIPSPRPRSTFPSSYIASQNHPGYHVHRKHHTPEPAMAPKKQQKAPRRTGSKSPEPDSQRPQRSDLDRLIFERAARNIPSFNSPAAPRDDSRRQSQSHTPAAAPARAAPPAPAVSTPQGAKVSGSRWGYWAIDGVWIWLTV